MNRPGLGLRPQMSSYGQGPSMMTLAQRQAQMSRPPPPQEINVFVGYIDGGITDELLNKLTNVSILYNLHSFVCI